MTNSQFDTSSWLRCGFTDAEGFRCRLGPSHEGDHRWSRCDWSDERGARCILPPEHSGKHQRFWYDEPSEAGSTRTIHYSGTKRSANALADRARELGGSRGWVERSRQFELGLEWRLPIIGRVLAALAEPQGAVTVSYELTDPGAGNRRST
jgi:hypothetical protein